MILNVLFSFSCGYSVQKLSLQLICYDNCKKYTLLYKINKTYFFIPIDLHCIWNQVNHVYKARTCIKIKSEITFEISLLRREKQDNEEPLWRVPFEYTLISSPHFNFNTIAVAPSSNSHPCSTRRSFVMEATVTPFFLSSILVYRSVLVRAVM